MFEVGLGQKIDIGHRIEIARGKMSRETLGALIGKSYKTLERWENIHFTGREGDLILIARATGVRLDWLKTGEEPMYPEGEEQGAQEKPAREPRTVADHIRQALFEAGRPLATSEIIKWVLARVETTPGNIRQELARLKGLGVIKQPRRGYYVAGGVRRDVALEVQESVGERIVRLLKEAGGSVKAGQLLRQVARESQTSEDYVRQELRRLVRIGVIESTRRGYYNHPSSTSIKADEMISIPLYELADGRLVRRLDSYRIPAPIFGDYREDGGTLAALAVPKHLRTEFPPGHLLIFLLDEKPRIEEMLREQRLLPALYVVEHPFGTFLQNVRPVSSEEVEIEDFGMTPRLLRVTGNEARIIAIVYRKGL